MSGETGELHVLYAALPPERPSCFCVTSETGGYGDDDINRRLFAEMTRWRPDMLLVVGDAVGDGRRYEDWERFFFGPGRELLHSTPFYLCPGNHEENADWFYRFTAFPEPGNFCGFDFGNVHFTAIDSTRFVDYEDGAPRATAELEEGSVQRRFLRQDLAAPAQKARWRIVFFHYPPYVSGDFEVPQMRELVPDLEAGPSTWSSVRTPLPMKGATLCGEVDFSRGKGSSTSWRAVPEPSPTGFEPRNPHTRHRPWQFHTSCTSR